MGLFDDMRAKGADLRITEEILYAEVLREMESGVRRDGLWAKALSESEMREGAAKAKYMKLRVQSLKDEYNTSMLEAREAEARKAYAPIGKQEPMPDLDPWLSRIGIVGGLAVCLFSLLLIFR